MNNSENVVDLDALEMLAKHALAESDIDSDWYDPMELSGREVSMADALHITANQPKVTLALVERIKSLENALEDMVAVIGAEKNQSARVAVLRDEIQILLNEGIKLVP